MQFRIEKADLNHLDALVTLFNEYLTFYGTNSPLENQILFLKDRIQKKESEIFVAMDFKQNMHGFVQLYPLFSSTRLKRLWLLNDLFVLESSRRQGISKLLIEKAKQLCLLSNSCGMILETEKSNLIGNKLYPNVGFELEVEHNYYAWNC